MTVMQKAKGAGKRPATVVMEDYLRQILQDAIAWRNGFPARCWVVIAEAEQYYEKISNDQYRKVRALKKIDKYKRYLKQFENHDYLFISDTGAAWNKDSLLRCWKRCCKSAGLEYFVPHELRHTHATIAGEANYSEKFLQAALRWDDPAMAKRYVHETRNMAQQVAGDVRNTLAEHLGRKIAQDDHSHEIRVAGIEKEIEIICPCCQKPVRLIPEDKKIKRN